MPLFFCERNGLGSEVLFVFLISLSIVNITHSKTPENRQQADIAVPSDITFSSGLSVSLFSDADISVTAPRSELVFLVVPAQALMQNIMVIQNARKIIFVFIADFLYFRALPNSKASFNSSVFFDASPISLMPPQNKEPENSAFSKQSTHP